MDRRGVARAAGDGRLAQGDILLLDRSDYGPFRARKVPYLFFSTGENPVYHTPRDTAETLDYPKLTAISRLILGSPACRPLDRVPAWSDTPTTFNEAVTIREVLGPFCSTAGPEDQARPRP